MQWRRRRICRLVAYLVISGGLSSGAVLAAEPSLVVLELSGTTELKLKDVSDPVMSYPLTLENRGKAPVKHAEVSVSRFVSAGGVAVSGTLSRPGASPGSAVIADVPAGGSLPLELGITLLQAATYRAVVRCVSDGKILLSFPIEIVRTHAPQPVEISDLPAEQATALPFHGDLSQSFEAAAYSADRTVILLPPLLQSAIRKPKADSMTGVASALRLEVGSQVTVQPGPPQTIRFTVQRLQGPGRYDVTIRFPAAGYLPIEKTVTIYVRDSAWMAVLWILLGALVSLGMHSYTSAIRPRLIVQQRVSTLFADLKALEVRAAKDPVALRLVQEVAGHLAQRWDAQRRRWRAPVAADFDLFDQVVQILPSWIEMHRLLLAIRPTAIGKDLLPILITAATAFARASPDAAEVQVQVKALEDLPARIDTARSVYVQQLSDDLKARIAATVPALAGVTADEWSGLQASIDKALAALDPLGEDVETKIKVVRDAVGEYLAAALKGLGRLAARIPDKDRAVMGQHIRDVQTQFAASELAAAWQSLGALDQEVRAALAKLPAGSMGPADAAMLAAAASPLGAPLDALDLIDLDRAPASDVLRRSGAAAAVERRIEASDYLLTVVVFAVAAVIGLQTLWADNPTWGGWLSYLAAFTWGFALDQFTHAGVLALRSAR